MTKETQILAVPQSKTFYPKKHPPALYSEMLHFSSNDGVYYLYPSQGTQPKAPTFMQKAFVGTFPSHHSADGSEV